MRQSLSGSAFELVFLEAGEIDAEFGHNLVGGVLDELNLLYARRRGRPAQVRLHNLTDIHTVRHAQRIENVMAIRTRTVEDQLTKGRAS